MFFKRGCSLIVPFSGYNTGYKRGRRFNLLGFQRLYAPDFFESHVLRHRKPEISMISGFFRGFFCYRWDLNCYIFKICPEKSHGHSRIELRRQCILDHILSLCIGISVKAVAAESSPFIVVTDHFSDGIDIDTSVYQ